MNKISQRVRRSYKLHQLRMFFEKCMFPLYREYYYLKCYLEKAYREKRESLDGSIDYEKYFSEAKHSNYDHFWVLGGYPLELIHELYLTPRMDQLKELCEGRVAGKKLLELGCSGGMFLQIAEQEGMKTHGLDISQLAIDEVHQLTHAKASQCDLATDDIPFAQDFFDVVVAFDLVEHVKDVPHLFSEVQRVLKPTGLFYFVTPNGRQPADTDETHFSLKKKVEWERITERYLQVTQSYTFDLYPPTPYLLIQKVLRLYNRLRGMKIEQVVIVAKKTVAHEHSLSHRHLSHRR